MSDRLAELRRQRALLQEHLAWLDREIARTEVAAAGDGVGSAPPPFLAATPELPLAGSPSVATPVAPPIVARPASAAATPEVNAVADSILEEYRVPTSSLRQDVRKGCLLYFAGAFVLLGLVLAILYFALSAR